ncbi:TonB-dependent receptor [Altererythrobacter sp. JGD-16]|uniref:TonB-dependent receptor n=2 Tax=Altererythrobacter lutimaris TaxID=2743979 RepID=A0A850HD88_9SPHN|nr:TonB-dependent receptor [Altererythrobacter lutimaris]NVE95550.1 TonB-dependent receptor [Altererythrobacter lutimaris]
MLTASIAATPAFANETSAGVAVSSDEQPEERAAAREEARESDPHYRGDIIVAAEALQQLDFIGGQDVVELDEIQRDLNGQLGDLLIKLPGVSATSFTPGASRPILRGLDGERVRVLVDGLGTADVGNTSADHATTIDPLTTERVEVLRGPAALLYGSQAIGGVVNVIDRRIPVAIPEDGFHVEALAAVDTATDLRSGGASLDFGLGENVVFNIGGSFRETDDVEIPGFQLSDDLRADLLADAEEEEGEGEFEEAEELREAANQKGFIPNSATETWTAHGGVGLFFGDSRVGASVSYYDTDYGLVGNPEGGHAHGEEGEGEEEEEEGEEIVTIGLEQLRVDVLGDFALGEGFLSRLKVRAGYSDYTHTEFEGPEVGTVYDTETFEARAELVQNGGGVIGVQFKSRDFAAAGEEAFVAPNDTTQLALFTVQEIELSERLQLEAAGRYEMVDVESDVVGVERSFDLFSGALSLVTELGEGVRAGITGSRSERAPAGEELFADGPHIATQQFEIGDVDLDTETAWGLEAFVRGDIGDASFGASVFYQDFDSFIYLNATGEEEDELPVFVYLQDDAKFFGFEADLNMPIVQTDSFDLIADLRASYVDADLDAEGGLPRIPPVSLLGALEAQFTSLDVRGEVQWFGSQDDVAEFETETDSFAFTNLYVSWRPLKDNPGVVVQLAGENLFDVTGRRHSSFTKEFVPLTGRNVRASVRLSF